jgi:signal transduction histidine kinase
MSTTATPFAPPAAAPAAPAPVPALPTLLIVDDEEGPRHSLRMVFRQDFTVYAVDNADQALEYARQNLVHIAILDIRMAGKSGVDVLRGLKTIDSRIEIIMLTAYETIETARQALRLGACDYLSKPFDLSTMREAVARALHLRRISDTVSSTSERLRALNEQLNDTTLKEEMARTTTEIYAGALHDINNPLTVIVGYVDLLRHRLEHTSSLGGAELMAMRDDVELLAKQVSTCSAITRRYLRFVNKRTSFAPEVPVNQALDDVQVLMRNHPSIRGGKLVIHPLEQDTSAMIGSTELIQILLNLAVNAFQSSPKPQTVTITAERFEHPLPIEKFKDGIGERVIGLESFADTAPIVALSVTDQGPGIPQDVLARIFEPYFTTKADKGTGLGLAIVTRLVKHHHGLTHVQTKVGEGTRFTIYFSGKEPTNSGQPF